VTTSNHVVTRAVYAVGGIAVVAVVCEAANLAAMARGAMAGAAVIVAVFAACWIIHIARPLLHPARPARTCEPELAVLADDSPAVQIAA
jgi:hypothetical protein